MPTAQDGAALLDRIAPNRKRFHPDPASEGRGPWVAELHAPRSSYLELRTLTGSDSSLTQKELTYEDRVAARRLENPLAPEPAVGPWQQREHRFYAEQLLRGFLSENGVHYTKEACREDWWLAEERTTKEVRLVPEACRERAHCPACGTKYGRDQGTELYDLLDAALERRGVPFFKKEALAWAFVFAPPAALNAHLADLASRAYLAPERRRLSRELSALQNMMRRILALAFGIHAKELTLVINWHYWHSYHRHRPHGVLRGQWWHAHVLVPNATRRRLRVSKWGAIPVHKLAHMRRLWKLALLGRYPWLEIPGDTNFHAHYFLNDEDGRRRLKHRCVYDSRHVMQDLVAYSQDDRCRFFGASAGARRDVVEVVRLVHLAELLQAKRLKLRRYLGYLHPGQRKQCGIRPAESTGRQWDFLAGGYRRLVRFVDRGVVVQGWDAAGVFYEFLHRRNVTFNSTAPPPSWRYESTETV